MARLTRRIPSTVVALGVVSLLTDLSSEMIYPLLPVFMVQVLGVGAVALGVVEGIAEATASLLKVVSGWMTDRSGRRKPLVVAGYGLSNAAKPLIGAATAWPVVALLRFADRLGKGIRTSPRDALIADVTDQDRRGVAYGLHRAMDHAGAVAGPLIAAGLLLIPRVGPREVFYLAAVPGVAVLLMLWLGVREPARGSPDPASAQALALATPLSPNLRRMLLAVAVFGLGNSTDAFLLLRFSELGVGAGWLAVLWAAHNAVRMTSTWLGGQMSDRLGRKRLMAAGWGLYALVYLGFGVTEDLAPLLILFLVYGIYFGLTEPAERAWVADLAKPQQRGAMFGLYHGVVGLAAFPASLAFGLLYSKAGPGAAFGTGAILAATALFLLVRVADPRSRSVRTARPG